MKVRGHESREAFHEWFESIEMGFAHYFDGASVGHTSFLNHRPADRSVEIGHTWLNPSAWGTGANTEAKYLLMRHAFEDEGLLRVEFKTDAANERSRPALEKIGATFEGIHRKHMLAKHCYRPRHVTSKRRRPRPDLGTRARVSLAGSRD